MRVGFIGLGTIGLPIALNLAEAGVDLLASSRSEAGFDAVRKAGASATTKLGDFSDCEVMFLCLPNGDVVDEVLFGGCGIAASAGLKIVVDLSTIDHSQAISIATRLEEAGIGFLDAPVSGMRARAVDGSLTLMCGGPKHMFDAVVPLFQTFATKILYMGQAGNGQLTKLVNQLLFDINMAAIAELMPLVARLGLDPDLVESVVNSGTGRSYASEFFLPRILKGSFQDGYPMGHAYKDLVSGAMISTAQRHPMPVLAAATTTYQMALREGLGHLDKGAMIQPYERIAGARFRSDVKKEDSHGPAA